MGPKLLQQGAYEVPQFTCRIEADGWGVLDYVGSVVTWVFCQRGVSRRLFREQQQQQQQQEEDQQKTVLTGFLFLGWDVFFRQWPQLWLWGGATMRVIEKDLGHPF